jgi:hypothetical protein
MLKMNQPKVYGIAGREGAGKSTSANYITNSDGHMGFTHIATDNIISYLIGLWFVIDLKTGRDVVWDMTFNEIKEKITSLFDTFYGNWKKESYTVVTGFERFCGKEWKIYALADLLKVGCSSLFGIPLTTLMGENDISRKEREVCTTQVFSSSEILKMNPEGHLTGRQCLQYMASEVFKRHFDDAFWNKILNAKIKIALDNGYRVLIPDARFYADITNVWNLGGTMIMVYRTEADLLLSSADKKTHPSCWEFLEVLAENKDKPVIYIKNDRSLGALQSTFASF